MSTPSFNFPNVALPFINPQTGTVDPVWYMFLMQVFRAVGGGKPGFDTAETAALLNTGRAPDIGGLTQALASIKAEFETSRPADRGLADLRALVDGLNQRLSTQGSVNLQPLLSRLDGLEAEFRSRVAALNVSDLRSGLEALRADYYSRRYTPASATKAIGDFVTATIASGAAVALANNTTANVTSLSLTAGDWDVSSTVDFSLAAATGSLFQSGVSLTSATLASQAGGSGLGTDPSASLPLVTTAATATLTQGAGPVRLQLTQTTTVYLVAQASFSAGAVSAYGTIRARRAALT